MIDKETAEREAMAMAVIERLGPHALTGGKMSPLDAFEEGWKAARALSASEAKAQDHFRDATEMIAKPAEAEQQAPHDGPPITAWVSINRVSGGKTLAFHKVTSGHDATLYSHIELREQAPAITEQAPHDEVANIPILINRVANTSFACGACDAVANSQQYLELATKANKAREELRAAIRVEQAPAGEVPSVPAAAFDRLSALNESNAARIFELEGQNAKLRAAIAALSTPPAVPSDWRMVPAEPTDEMRLAFWLEWKTSHSQSDGQLNPAYQAMLSAAPAAPDIQNLVQFAHDPGCDLLKTALIEGMHIYRICTCRLAAPGEEQL